MYWKDEGYLLSKTNFDENSIIIEAFTSQHGKYTGIVYGGSSRKHKGKFQVGNKFLLHWKSKSENRIGYFDTELLEAVSPLYFDDKTIADNHLMYRLGTEIILANNLKLFLWNQKQIKHISQNLIRSVKWKIV